MKKQNSFTLIELLVVISIIALISSIVFVALSGARDKARRAAGLQFAASVHHALGAEAVGIWDFENNFNDSSGYNNNGTCSNCPDFISNNTPSGKGSAVSFNGTNDSISMGTAASLKPATISLAAWVYMPSLPGSAKVILGKQYNVGGSASYALVFRTSNSRVTFTISNSAGAEYHAVSTKMQAGVWQHWVGTYDGTNLKIYLDGSFENTTPQAITIAYSDSYNFIIGYYAPLGYFNGIIDDVRIYAQALSSAQIQKIYVEGARERGLLARE